MPAVAQLTRNQLIRKNTLVIDSNRVSRGVGDSVRELLKRLGHSIQGYYSSLESSSQYPYTLSNPLAVTYTDVVEQLIRIHLGKTLLEIAGLLNWDTGWNGYDALKPEPAIVRYAIHWFMHFFLEVASLEWVEPNITCGSDGEVVFEWWFNQRKLTIYVGEESIDYVQVWGTDVNAKITDGSIESINDYRPLWTWLMSRT